MRRAFLCGAGENREALSDYLNKNTSHKPVDWLDIGKKVLEYVKDNPSTIFKLALGIAKIVGLGGA